MHLRGPATDGSRCKPVIDAHYISASSNVPLGGDVSVLVQQRDAPAVRHTHDAADGQAGGQLRELGARGGRGLVQRVWNPGHGDLLTWPEHQKRLTLHTRVTLGAYATLILIGGLGILIGEAGASLAGSPPLRAVQLAAFQAVSARTAGFAVLPSWEYLTEASRWLLMPLMFIGSAPASMGGGITTGTFAVMILSLWSYVRGLPDTRMGHRTLAAETVRRVGAVLTVSLLALGAAAWLILITHRVPATLALFEVVSAFAATGMPLSFTGQLNLFGQLIIMAMMFWGRLGALTIVVALAKPRPPQPIFYPQETLLIG